MVSGYIHKSYTVYYYIKKGIQYTATGITSIKHCYTNRSYVVAPSLGWHHTLYKQRGPLGRVLSALHSVLID